MMIVLDAATARRGEYGCNDGPGPSGQISGGQSATQRARLAIPLDEDHLIPDIHDSPQAYSRGSTGR
jgi:hypothetical protein